MNRNLFPILCFLLLALSSYALQHLNPGHLLLKNNNLDAFRKAQLKRHNQLRAKHRAPNLSLDPTLNDFAQKYAQKLAAIGTMSHSHGPYGQNLYYAFSQPPQNYLNGAATNAWYDEIKFYNWNKPTFSSQTGHFTQVVWKASQKVGFGFASNSKGQDFIVAEYDPPGNYQGQYAKNVLKN